MVVTLKWVKHVPASQVSQFFLQGMLNRMVHGFHRYGHVLRQENAPDSIKCLRQRLTKYRQTGNKEWLIDIANYAMMEFMAPRHPKAHYRATSADESPGAVLVGGVKVKRIADQGHHVKLAREGD